MRRDQAPLLVGETARLVENRLRHTRLADVVKERRHSEIIQLQLVQTETLAERDREDADVDAVRERVLVVIANRRQTDQRRLLREDLVDDALHDALDLLDVRAALHAHRSHQVARRRDGLRVRALRPLLRLFGIRRSGLRRRREAERLNLCARELRLDYRQPLRGIVGARRLNQRQEDEPVLWRQRLDDGHRSDAGGAEQREQMAEAREVVEIEAEARLIDEDEFARHAQLDLTFARDQLVRLRRELGERLLYGGVLDGIELHGAQGTVHREDQLSSGAAHIGVAVVLAVRMRRRRRARSGGRQCHGQVALGGRIALFTALRTTTSFSSSAF